MYTSAFCTLLSCPCSNQSLPRWWWYRGGLCRAGGYGCLL